MKKTTSVIVLILGIILLTACIPQKGVSPIALCGDTISADDFGNIETTLSKALDQVNSLEEFENWLNTQRCIQSAGLGEKIIELIAPDNTDTPCVTDRIDEILRSSKVA